MIICQCPPMEGDCGRPQHSLQWQVSALQAPQHHWALPSEHDLKVTWKPWDLRFSMVKYGQVMRYRWKVQVKKAQRLPQESMKCDLQLLWCCSHRRPAFLGKMLYRSFLKLMELAIEAWQQWHLKLRRVLDMFVVCMAALSRTLPGAWEQGRADA